MPADPHAARRGSVAPCPGAATAGAPAPATVAGSRRRRTAARSRVVTARRSSGSASTVAAATASCTARLIPTPPTGDMACAASPMQSRPSTCQRLSRFSRTSRCLTSSIDAQRADPVREVRHQLRDVVPERLDAAAAQLRVGALAGDVGDLEEVGARDHHREPTRAGARGERVRVVLGRARQAEPPGVDRHAELVQPQVGLLPRDRPAPVAGDHQVREDLARWRRPASGTAPRGPGRPRGPARSPRCPSAA